MPPKKRIVVPGIPHHITQRAARKVVVFENHEHFSLMKKLLTIYQRKSGTMILSWCLMPNHIHLLVVPDNEDGLRQLLAPTLRSFAFELNRRTGHTGHLWQGPFHSSPLDEAHSIAAARYIDLNPVRARLVAKPDEYHWSSAFAHMTGRDDGLTDLAESASLVDDWAGLLASDVDESMAVHLHNALRKNQPLGNSSFLEELRNKKRKVPSARRGHPATLQ
jgi:putative transposase